MRISVLDHGYVEFIEAWGTGRDGFHSTGWNSDSGQIGHYEIQEDFEVGIIEAARQSTQGAFRGWRPTPCNCSARGLMLAAVTAKLVTHDDGCNYQPGDAKLLQFLHTNRHSTPFEMAGLVIEVQAPIFVFREWHRHRTQSYNEASARYAPLSDLYYTPDLSNLHNRAVASMSSRNRQATAHTVFDGVELAGNCGDWYKELTEFYQKAEELYQSGLARGIPKELARLVMPVGHYSKMRASANLRNWLAFLTLRLDPAAQWEIRQFAGAVGVILKEKFPRTWSLFNETQGTQDTSSRS